MKKKAHTKYIKSDGTQVPGVTTIIDGNLGWNKNILVAWSRKTALAGDDPNKVKDQAGDIGTLAHHLILCHLKKITPVLDEYSKSAIDQAENCLLSYWEWEKSNPFEPLFIEEPLVSEIYDFGGTPDCVGKFNGDVVLLDYKTGSGIYPEMVIQVSAYKQLLTERGFTTSKAKILRIPKTEDDSFDTKDISLATLDVAFEVFKNCLNLHGLRNKIK